MASNAVGAVATLSFIGARLSQDPTGGYGFGIFACLSLFILGAASAFFSLCGDVLHDIDVLKTNNIADDGTKASVPGSLSKRFRDQLFLVSGFCMALATILGLSQLYQLA